MKKITLIALLLAMVLLPVTFAVAEDNDIQQDVQANTGVLPVNCSELNSVEALVAQNTCPAGWLNCYVSCGSITNACCPKETPYLNYCDCQCYNSSPNCYRGYAVCR